MRNILATLLFLTFLFYSCNTQKDKKSFTIGFSQCTGMDSWRQTMLNEMKLELSFYDEIEFIYKDANAKSNIQVNQIEELAALKIDLLIVSPNEVQPLTPAIEKVFYQGIPVVVVDRRTNSSNYTSFIGASNLEVGRDAGNYAVSLLNAKGKIIEVTGIPDASPVIDRHNGFMEVISRFPEINFLKKFDNYITADTGYENPVEKFLLSNPDVDLVYAQNDYMASHLFDVCKKLKLEQRIKIIGIDGLAGENEGLDMVRDKKIAATVLYPTGGQEAIRTAINILNHKPYKKDNELFITIIDSSNVVMMKKQAEKVNIQQKDIELRQERINQLALITKNQSTIILIISLLLLLAIFFGAISYYYLKENKKITRTLEHQNKEIAEQKNRIEEISAKAEVAHQAKLNFFTNISHEFRTPLTLILSPLEELLDNPRIQSATKLTVQLVQRNVMRLYRLVNQLMDFRKIEFDKMPLHVSEIDLVAFTKEIADSYNVLAKSKHIDFRFFTTEKKLDVWFDITMIDKVIFNLLSNAFKFTKENGYIYVSITKNEDDAILSVEDNGIGMSKEAIEHAFEPFFQGEYENYNGTGLGLALSKELIELHNGSITVKSEKWKGAKFEIKLPLGKIHFTDSEITDLQNKESLITEDAKIYTTELLPMMDRESDILQNDRVRKNQNILIIEDNEDLRNYLKDRLGKKFDILEADNGNTALHLAMDNIPDLIISDIVIPGKNGLEITQILKNDVRTAHIPVILLTSRSDEKQKLEGMETQADAYVTKPFSLPLLEKTISNFLVSRERIKEHYTTETFTEGKPEAIKKSDRKFVSEFSAIVEHNLANDKFAVDDICREIGISKVQLYRKVKILLSCNVNDYIITTRLAKAKYYLQHENLSISEIAFKTGFSSAAYFTTVFKSKFGVTPSEYKMKK